MIANSVQEEAKLIAMQRAWQTPSRRLVSSVSVFEETPELEAYCPLPRQNSCSAIGRTLCIPAPSTFTSSDVDSDNEVELSQEKFHDLFAKQQKPQSFTILDASELGDLPAQYKIGRLQSHELPVIGVYIDKRVTPGFKYRVRGLPSWDSPDEKKQYLFDGKALTLKSIGRGYARRFTFEPEPNCLNNNENYFWSDNRPEGFAFEIEAISAGDKFTICDLDDQSQGTAEVLKIETSPRSGSRQGSFFHTSRVSCASLHRLRLIILSLLIV